MNMKTYLKTQNTATVWDSNFIPHQVSNDHPKWQQIIDSLRDDSITADEIVDMMSMTRVVEEYLSQSHLVKLKNGVVYFNDEPVDNAICDQIIRFIEEGVSPTPLLNFLENLKFNPSKRSVDNLWRFIQHNRIAWTDDGHFMVYKKVRSDYKDIHSGKFDNSPGSVVSMHRNQVDEDPDVTCSQGLHVCSWDYLSHYGSCQGNRVVLCKVNPAHVVAVPKDYDNAKMRVSCYKVMKDVTEEAGVDFLSTSALYGDETYEDYDGYYYDEDYYDGEYEYNDDFEYSWPNDSLDRF